MFFRVFEVYCGYMLTSVNIYLLFLQYICCRSSLNYGDLTWKRRRNLKKHRKTDRPMTPPLFILRCVQIGLSLSELDLLTIGVVNDMFTEMENDEYDGWMEQASQADMDMF